MSILNSKAAMDIALLVEKYRQQRHVTDKYIREHESKDALREELVRFYKSQGIDNVTPEMVDAGIEAYEKNRFTFSGFKGSQASSFIANKILKAYPLRFMLLFLLVIVPPITIAGLYGVVYGIDQVEATMAESKRSDIDSFLAKIKAEKNKSISQYKSRLILAQSDISIDMNDFSYSKSFVQSEISEIKKLVAAAASDSKILESGLEKTSADMDLSISSASSLSAEDEKKRIVDEYERSTDSLSKSINVNLSSAEKRFKNISNLRIAERDILIIQGSVFFKKMTEKTKVADLHSRAIFEMTVGDGLSALDLILTLRDEIKEGLTTKEKLIPEPEVKQSRPAPIELRTTHNNDLHKELIQIEDPVETGTQERLAGEILGGMFNAARISEMSDSTNSFLVTLSNIMKAMLSIAGLIYIASGIFNMTRDGDDRFSDGLFRMISGMILVSSSLAINTVIERVFLN